MSQLGNGEARIETSGPQGAGATRVHEDWTEDLSKVFYLRFQRGPDYEHAYLCIRDGEPDMLDVARVSFKQARLIQEAFHVGSTIARDAVLEEAASVANADTGMWDRTSSNGNMALGPAVPPRIGMAIRALKAPSVTLASSPSPLQAREKGE